MHNSPDMLIWRGKYRALGFVTLINKLFSGSGTVSKIPMCSRERGKIEASEYRKLSGIADTSHSAAALFNAFKCYCSF